MKTKTKGRIVSHPTNTEKQPLKSDGISRAARYNYIDMKDATAEARTGFANTLTALRTTKGISAREMSLSLGQSASYINDIENGRALPSLPMFFEICEYLSIPPAEFFQYTADSDRNILAELEEVMSGLSKSDLLLLLRVAERMQQKG